VENVQTAAEARPGVGTAAARRLAGALLERVGLAEVADTPADLLPVGLARLLEVARALATSPTVVLLDEPSAGLDAEETGALGRVLTSLADDGLAVLLVEHDVELVMRTSGQVVVLDTGSVIASGRPEAVRADPAVQEAYLGAPSAHSASSAPAGSGTAVRATTQVAFRTVEPDVAAPGTGRDQQTGPVLALSAVHAGYGRIEVLRGVDLTVATGSVAALLGPNGAGKSTLLKVVSGRLAATAGTVHFDGRSTTGVSSERLARQGLCAVPEGRAIFPNLTVAENLRVFSARLPLTTAAVEERTYARFPVLAQRRRQLAGRLSGGEQQMLGLARALAASPKLLLLDELSMGLAPMVVAELYELVAALAAEEGVSILLVEQFATMALRVADTAAVLVNGRLVDHGSPLDVGDDLAQAYLGGR
jgi:ABC-type branched-subunit amino acid transport system ATPase component